MYKILIAKYIDFKKVPSLEVEQLKKIRGTTGTLYYPPTTVANSNRLFRPILRERDVFAIQSKVGIFLEAPPYLTCNRRFKLIGEFPHLWRS